MIDVQFTRMLFFLLTRNLQYFKAQKVLFPPEYLSQDLMGKHQAYLLKSNSTIHSSFSLQVL